jgi:hypothetical protein
MDMLVVKQMEKLWESRKYGRLLEELLAWRVESLAADELRQHACLASAALALIRLDELHQGNATICPTFIRAILAHQDRDGGWGDPMLTALCLRALSINDGSGEGPARGLAYLADLQQASGIWPRIPIRRMPQDAFVSAFVLLQLGENERFRAAVDLTAALAWFESHLDECDGPTRILWSHAKLRAAPILRPDTLWQLSN